MRITQAAKWITGAALAAALLVAAPKQAQAQIGFQVGVGTYGAPGYAAYGTGYGPRAYWHRDRWIEQQRAYDWQARRAAEWRHGQWEQAHDEHRFGYRGWGGGARYDDRRY